MSKIVLGTQFGDEGKGLTTSYLCSKAQDPLVVRFNGGHQAGHTVVKDGLRHVFSSFGSGTLQNVPTYWSQFCTFSPIAFQNELLSLKEKHKVTPSFFIHPLCPVTTPFDMIHNHTIEAGQQHGSCGVGINATLRRQESFYKLFVQDLFYEQVLVEKLKNIGNWYKISLDLEPFLEIVKNILPSLIVEADLRSFKDKELIFEGAQGILLDQDFGFFPNVTPSNTTSKNAREICPSLFPEVYLVTRTYQTRHGNGFMTNENLGSVDLINNENETNVSNRWQGEFRKSILDLDLLKYSLQCESNFTPDSRRHLIITCVDQTGEDFYITSSGNLEPYKINIEDLPKILGFPSNRTLISYGDTIDKLVNLSTSKQVEI